MKYASLLSAQISPQYHLPEIPQYHRPELRGRQGKQTFCSAELCLRSEYGKNMKDSIEDKEGEVRPSDYDSP